LLLGARPLFTRYGNLLGILNAVYPEQSWGSSKFFYSGITPVGFWKDIKHQREEIEAVSAQLGIKEVKFCQNIGIFADCLFSYQIGTKSLVLRCA